MKNKSGFAPLMTNKNGFSKTEKDIYKTFIDLGAKEGVAKATAHAYTKYMLGYYTDRGVAQELIDAGATEDFAISVANMFRQIKFGSDAPKSGDSTSATTPHSSMSAM